MISPMLSRLLRPAVFILVGTVLTGCKDDAEQLRGLESAKTNLCLVARSDSLRWTAMIKEGMARSDSISDTLTVKEYKLWLVSPAESAKTVEVNQAMAEW